MKSIVRYGVVLLIFCLTALAFYGVVQKNPTVVSALGLPAGMGREGFRPDFAGDAAGEGQFEGHRPGQRPSANLTDEQIQQLQAGQRPPDFNEGGFEREGRGEGRQGAAGWFGILRNLAIIAVVTAVVVAIKWLYARLFGRRKPARPRAIA